MARGILVTRPEPGLGETARAVAALGLEPIACPLLRIRMLRHRLPAARLLQAILLTSAQALPSLRDAARSDPALRQLPLLAVGDGTAARALGAGFAASVSAGGDAADLERLIRTRLPTGAALLLPTASGQGQALCRRLRLAGNVVHRRVVYAADCPDGLSAAGLAALDAGHVAACLFFSAETARNFDRLCPVPLRQSLRAVRALAISPQVASTLDAMPWRAVQAAPRPDSASLLSLLDPLRRQT